MMPPPPEPPAPTAIGIEDTEPRVVVPANSPPAPPPPAPPPPPPATIKYSTLKFSAGGVQVQDSTVLNETTVCEPSVETNGLLQVVVINGTALAGAKENDSSAENAKGMPEKIAKVKRANVPLRTLRIWCFSCQIVRPNIYNHLENFTGSTPTRTSPTMNKK
jgi:hypothetical protein